MSVSEIEPTARAAERQRPVYGEETLAAKIDLERVSVECEDARNRWIGREIELRDFDQKHRGGALAGGRVEDDPDVLLQRSRLTGLLGEARVDLKRAEAALRDAGARHRELATRDEYRFRQEQMRAMYAQRDAEDRAREDSLRRRRSLLGRFRR